MAKRNATVVYSSDHMNFLYLMISGRWDYLLPLSRDRNGVTFIDLDPALMKPILDRLRYRLNYGTNEHMIPRISIDKRAIFDKVVLYYRIGDIAYNATTFSEESTIECMKIPIPKCTHIIWLMT